MSKIKYDSKQNRRQFIASVVPVCAFPCLSLATSLAKTQSNDKINSETGIEKFQNDFCRSYEEAWEWRYYYYIDRMEEFAKVLGREKLIELIKNGIDEINRRDVKNDPKFKLSELANSLKNSDYFNSALNFEIIKLNDVLFEFKVTECLWAKTFHKKNAKDIGYAACCHGDFSNAKALHHQLHIERTKTLMQGFDCCNFRYIFEA